MSPMMANATGKSAPAPRPWMPRDTMSHSIDVDMPARIEPTRKMPMPTMKMGRRPYMSDSFP